MGGWSGEDQREDITSDDDDHVEADFTEKDVWDGRDGRAVMMAVIGLGVKDGFGGVGDGKFDRWG